MVARVFHVDSRASVIDRGGFRGIPGGYVNTIIDCKHLVVFKGIDIGCVSISADNHGIVSHRLWLNCFCLFIFKNSRLSINFCVCECERESKTAVIV